MCQETIFHNATFVFLNLDKNCPVIHILSTGFSAPPYSLSSSPQQRVLERDAALRAAIRDGRARKPASRSVWTAAQGAAGKQQRRDSRARKPASSGAWTAVGPSRQAAAPGRPREVLPASSSACSAAQGTAGEQQRARGRRATAT